MNPNRYLLTDNDICKVRFIPASGDINGWDRHRGVMAGGREAIRERLLPFLEQYDRILEVLN
ncbi:MAG TPA: hypothetical protein VNQ76_09295 [Planctomicrobium sp.]|nr:hypothetical protein [Planctomicrobium sp.]